MSLIFDRTFIMENHNHFENWQLDAFNAFLSKMKCMEKKFPCIPATQGFTMNHFRYAFIDDPTKTESVRDLAEKFSYYTKVSRYTGKYASFIVFFNTPSIMRETSSSLQIDQQLFWRILSKLKEYDHVPWPSHIPTNPHHKDWEYCFAGEPYFVYCATPKHIKRNSRSFPYLMLAITPRWVLNEFNKNSSLSRKIKNKIRDRLKNYDHLPPHPDLNQYGNVDNFEWKQYFLSDNDSSLPSCPFSKMFQEID
ncbi:FPC/CPF motif-containing protein YcgG [Bacillus pakistanensis]|uniref:FPC/CPF motif-containing protein YcgG n=1 Tax=Rossellomorea pakistanensis TaxID=992288 RepID=A0ABS2NCK5_9BACI|nr:YqcI/YcgG family protein [Bacillus pakistanensis]MBM7585563.1 FPC/CPF motif-containing protein YcgG [Bacillus pakistanensis]